MKITQLFKTSQILFPANFYAENMYTTVVFSEKHEFWRILSGIVYGKIFFISPTFQLTMYSKQEYIFFKKKIFWKFFVLPLVKFSRDLHFCKKIFQKTWKFFCHRVVLKSRCFLANFYIENLWAVFWEQIRAHTVLKIYI